MNAETFLNLTLVINLVSSLMNVLAYGYGLYTVNRSQVDGELKRIKRNLLFQFIIVTVVAVLYSVVFYIVAFLREYTSQALYLLDFALLFFNIGFNANALYFARIVEGYKKRKGV